MNKITKRMWRVVSLCISLVCVFALTGCEQAVNEPPSVSLASVKVNTGIAAVNGYVELDGLSVGVTKSDAGVYAVSYQDSPDSFSFAIGEEPAVGNGGKLPVGFGAKTVVLTYKDKYGSASTTFNVQSTLSTPELVAGTYDFSTGAWNLELKHALDEDATFGSSIRRSYTIEGSSQTYVVNDKKFTVATADDLQKVVGRVSIVGADGGVIVSADSKSVDLASKPTTLSEPVIAVYGKNSSADYDHGIPHVTIKGTAGDYPEGTVFTLSLTPEGGDADTKTVTLGQAIDYESSKKVSIKATATAEGYDTVTSEKILTPVFTDMEEVLEEQYYSEMDGQGYLWKMENFSEDLWNNGPSDGYTVCKEGGGLGSGIFSDSNKSKRDALYEYCIGYGDVVPSDYAYLISKKNADSSYAGWRYSYNLAGPMISAFSDLETSKAIQSGVVILCKSF